MRWNKYSMPMLCGGAYVTLDEGEPRLERVGFLWDCIKDLPVLLKKATAKFLKGSIRTIVFIDAKMVCSCEASRPSHSLRCSLKSCFQRYSVD